MKTPEQIASGSKTAVYNNTKSYGEHYATRMANIAYSVTLYQIRQSMPTAITVSDAIDELRAIRKLDIQDAIMSYYVNHIDNASPSVAREMTHELMQKATTPEIEEQIRLWYILSLIAKARLYHPTEWNEHV